VVLGNTADAYDNSVAQTLQENLAASDPMLRSHAEWAALELGRTDLLAGTVQ
jgi:epoxyqueuosine reductase QueG